MNDDVKGARRKSKICRMLLHNDDETKDDA